MTFDTFTTLSILGCLGIVCFTILHLLKNKGSESNTKRNKHQNMTVTLQNPDIKYLLPLAHKENVSHDTRLFRFQLPSAKHILGLPIGQHVYLSTRINGELVKRAYTPITSDDNQGYFDLVVKIYPQGKMTQYLDKLSVGETIDVSGPSGNIVYIGKGVFNIRPRKPDPFVPRRIRQLGLIAGGSGITPMYQILNEILKEQMAAAPSDRVDIKIWLLYANQTEQDILLRSELELLATSNPDRFKIWYTVDRPNEEWKYSKGFIDETMLSQHMPPPGDDVLVCICGPPPMIKFACIPNLDKLGFAKDMEYTF